MNRLLSICTGVTILSFMPLNAVAMFILALRFFYEDSVHCHRHARTMPGLSPYLASACRLLWEDIQYAFRFFLQ